jgi:diguanylate cyclase (GGDEF)-like protein
MLLRLQNSILQLLATGEALKPCIDRLCVMVEAMTPDVICSVLEVDSNGFIHPISGPSLPGYYCEALDGLVAGPKAGSCGTAAYYGRPVMVTDIENDPLWADYKALALPLGLRACWSTPIINDGKVVGTFAFYYREPRGPSEMERKIVDACVHLTSIALERDQRIRERQHLAFTDALTNLPNRACFNTVFSRQMRRRDHAWGIIIADLDNLKLINDTFGHAAGDDLLQTLADRIAAIAEADQAFRLGGDEFAIIVKGDLTVDLKSVANRIIQSLKQPCQCAGNVVFPSATLGGAIAARGALHETVLQNADYALYHAKERSRGQYVEFVEGIGTAITERFRAIHDVSLALSENRMHAHYQPLVDLTSGEIVGFEALCRMVSQTGEIIPAAKFHSATTDAQIAAQLTRLMLTKVAEDMRRWMDMGLEPKHVSVNLSEADFYNGNVQDLLSGIFAQTGAPLNHLVLEVTESVYMGHREHVIAEEVAKLRAQGIKVALDDFGTGFASLTHLMSVPVDIIKIDKSFTDRLRPGDAGMIIVEGLLDIAAKLGIHVVAEGIETAQQAQILVDFRCKYGQGYFFSRAVPFCEATALLRAEGAMSRPALRQSA